MIIPKNLSFERREPDYPVWLQVEPGGSGVYVLKEANHVAYVGKTNCLARRLLHHHVIDYRMVRLINRERARLFLWECSDPDMTLIESYLIHCFRPYLNSVFPSFALPDLATCERLEAILSEISKL